MARKRGRGAGRTLGRAVQRGRGRTEPSEPEAEYASESDVSSESRQRKTKRTKVGDLIREHPVSGDRLYQVAFEQ